MDNAAAEATDVSEYFTETEATEKSLLGSFRSNTTPGDEVGEALRRTRSWAVLAGVVSCCIIALAIFFLVGSGESVRARQLTTVVEEETVTSVYLVRRRTKSSTDKRLSSTVIQPGRATRVPEDSSTVRPHGANHEPDSAAHEPDTTVKQTIEQTTDQSRAEPTKAEPTKAEHTKLLQRTNQQPEKATQLPSIATSVLKKQDRPPPLGARPLVCVYANGSKGSATFPEDGLCDAVFFDSLYKYPGHALAATAKKSPVGLTRFLGYAKKYKRSRFGMGVAARGVKTALTEFTSGTAKKNYLPHLGDNNVYDLGVVDFVPDEKTKVRHIELVYQFLRECKRLQRQLFEEDGFKTYVVLGIALFKTHHSIYDVFTQQMRKRAVDVVILRTHFSGRDDTQSNCVIQGSTYWMGSVTRYHPSMNYTLLYMGKYQELFKDSINLISMSLAGRWYRSKIGGKNREAYMVGARCKPYDRKRYLYELESFKYTTKDAAFGPKHTFLDEERFVMVSYNPKTGYSLLFDSEATIHMKMCLSYNTQSSVPFGLALFDAEYDDWSSPGGKSPSLFPLTHAARNVIDIIKTNSTRHFSEPLKCMPPK